MKSRYVIGLIVIIALAAVGYFALESSTVQYADFDKAAQLGKTVQVVGTWVQDEGCSYDPASNIFRFTLEDENGKRMKVELEGAKPNNFEIAVSVVVKGHVDGQVMKASNVLTKCPSKYEGSPEKKVS